MEAGCILLSLLGNVQGALCYSRQRDLEPKSTADQLQDALTGNTRSVLADDRERELRKGKMAPS